jgi:hypothetical protein
MTQRERIAAPREQRTPTPRGPVPEPAGLLALQRTAGNQAVVRMLARSPGATPAPEAAAAPTVRVEGGATGSTQMGPDQWGLTWPESIDVTIDARKDGTGWRPVVTELVGRYSVQSRLLPGVQPVKGPGVDTTEANYRRQIADLDSLAPVGHPVQWYMIEAVDAHEAVHAQHMDPAFKAIAPRTIAVLEEVTIPDDGTLDAEQAALRLEKDPAFTEALGKRLLMWQLDTADAAIDDHNPTGPTKAAERAVVDEMIRSIRAEAVKQGWPL